LIINGLLSPMTQNSFWGAEVGVGVCGMTCYAIQHFAGLKSSLTDLALLLG